MIVRKATISDIDLLMDNRFEFLSLFFETFPDHLEVNTKDYLSKHLADNTLICYIAVENDVILSSAMMCIYNILPTVKNPNGRNGYLYNVYTKREWQRRGLSTQIIKNVIKEAKSAGVEKIMLDFTDDGLELYEKLGFQHLSRQMELYIG